MAALLIILALSYRVDVSQLRVDELSVHNAAEKMERIVQQPYDSQVFQAGMLADAKLVLETAKRIQRIDQMEAWFYLIVLVIGTVLLIYKWVKQ